MHYEAFEPEEIDLPDDPYYECPQCHRLNIACVCDSDYERFYDK